MYDCGCELNEYGQYGRKDYIPHATRGTLSLHSWYLMLLTNFGAFCVGLITQPNVLQQISSKYCVTVSNGTNFDDSTQDCESLCHIVYSLLRINLT